jgi:hypothetical protein
LPAVDAISETVPVPAERITTVEKSTSAAWNAPFIGSSCAHHDGFPERRRSVLFPPVVKARAASEVPMCTAAESVAASGDAVDVSVTVRRAIASSGAAYVCHGVGPAAVAPSPKDHRY